MHESKATRNLPGEMFQKNKDEAAISFAVHIICSALGGKRFNPDDPAYQDVIDFEIFTATMTSPVCLGTMNWIGFMNAMAEAVRVSPEWQGWLRSMEIQMDSKGPYAEAFLDLAVTGEPPGVTRHIIGLMRFLKKDGVWKCFSHQNITGGMGASL